VCGRIDVLARDIWHYPAESYAELSAWVTIGFDNSVASRPPGYGLCAAGLDARLLLPNRSTMVQAGSWAIPAGRCKSDPIDGLEIRVFECHTGMARAARRVTPQLIGKVDTPFWRTFARDSRLS
jgi:hypothetical protein